MKKRCHKKSHGVASFQEIAQVVADGWKTIDEETLSFCTAMAKILKQRYTELKSSGGLESFFESGYGEKRSPKIVRRAKPKDRDENASTDFSTCTLRCSQSLDELRDNDVGEVPMCVPCARDVMEHTAVPRQAAQRPRPMTRDLLGPGAVRRLSDSFPAVHSQVNGPGTVRRVTDSSTTIHSQVDIPDIDIVAMWLNY